MKFTTYIPLAYNAGTPVKPVELKRLIQYVWYPFKGMTHEGEVAGHWIDEDGTEFTDRCVRISIVCERSELIEVMRRVRHVGLKLGQRAMYIEVLGYDGAQILRVA